MLDPLHRISANMSSASGKRLRVLVDVDGVLADFEGGFLKKYRARYPNDPYISLEDREGFWVSAQYGQLRSDLCVSERIFITITDTWRVKETPHYAAPHTLKVPCELNHIYKIKAGKTPAVEI